MPSKSRECSIFHSERRPIENYTVPWTWTIYATSETKPKYYVQWQYATQPIIREGPFPTAGAAMCRIWDLMLEELVHGC